MILLQLAGQPMLDLLYIAAGITGIGLFVLYAIALRRV